MMGQWECNRQQTALAKTKLLLPRKNFFSLTDFAKNH